MIDLPRSWWARPALRAKPSSADLVDIYSAMAGSDVREEWDDDTGEMLYGDWEDEGLLVRSLSRVGRDG